MKRWLLGLAIVTSLFLAFTFAAAAVLAEASIHPSILHTPAQTASLARNIDKAAVKVSIQSTDGVHLNAWWLPANESSNRAVIVCHGIGDSAYGGLGFAPLFLAHGYSVLVPDSRGHGESGGFVTFGVLESSDVVQWISWMKRKGASDVFGLGESLGAAILIQSLAKGAQLKSLVAECSYSSFTSAADQRVARKLPSPIAWLVVREAILYIDLRYRVNLFHARPDQAIAAATIPILLIHGEADDQTSPENSIRLAKANPKFTTLWLVPAAGHVGAYQADPTGFEKRVLKCF